MCIASRGMRSGGFNLTLKELPSAERLLPWADDRKNGCWIVCIVSGAGVAGALLIRYTTLHNLGHGGRLKTCVVVILHFDRASLLSFCIYSLQSLFDIRDSGYGFPSLE